VSPILEVGLVVLSERQLAIPLDFLETVRVSYLRLPFTAAALVRVLADLSVVGVIVLRFLLVVGGLIALFLLHRTLTNNSARFFSIDYLSPEVLHLFLREQFDGDGPFFDEELNR
jgi:hypothetical protein